MLRPRPPRRPARAVIAGLLISLAGVAAAAPAVATDTTPGFAQYQRAQAKVDFTVYVPTTPVTVPFDSLHRFACGGDRGAFINVNYGSQAARADQWIGLIESPGTVGCSDGPDGVGPAATFMVNGARARVLGACAGGRPTCTSSTAALVKQQAYTVVTLPGSASRPTTTYVEVYTQAVSLARIKDFVRGLAPVT